MSLLLILSVQRHLLIHIGTCRFLLPIMFHSDDLSALKDYIHPSILPQEFGGEAETFENTKWSNIIDESTDQVMNLLRYGYKD
ncbi:UNVERIFIED_CONTAM: hypothetical protein NCL1_14027 [Trichonephila clavipes]